MAPSHYLINRSISDKRQRRVGTPWLINNIYTDPDLYRSSQDTCPQFKPWGNTPSYQINDSITNRLATQQNNIVVQMKRGPGRILTGQSILKIFRPFKNTAGTAQSYFPMRFLRHYRWLGWEWIVVTAPDRQQMGDIWRIRDGESRRLMGQSNNCFERCMHRKVLTRITPP